MGSRLNHIDRITVVIGMPDDILEVPVHPLAVHLPVVLVPLLALCVVAYVVVPRVRRQTGWVLVALSAAAPPAVLAAVLSGDRLAEERLSQTAPDFVEPVTDGITGHAQYGPVLFWLVVAMAPPAWLFAGLVSGRLAGFARHRSWSGLTDRAESPAGNRGVIVGLGVVLVVLAALSAFYTVMAGHSGAALHWAV